MDEQEDYLRKLETFIQAEFVFESEGFHAGREQWRRAPTRESMISECVTVIAVVLVLLVSGLWLMLCNPLFSYNGHQRAERREANWHRS